MTTTHCIKTTAPGSAEGEGRITRLMEQAGLPEPSRRLTEKRDHVSQWCSKHWLEAGEHKGGGKRRRASWPRRLFDGRHGRGVIGELAPA